MRFFLFAAAGLLSACGPSFDVGMKIDRVSAPSSTLIGSITEHPDNTGFGLKGIVFEASDGIISCRGETLNGEWHLSGLRDKYRYRFPISCSDGSKGDMDLRLSLGPVNGIGVGQMTDGSKLKVLVGDLSGTIGW